MRLLERASLEEIERLPTARIARELPELVSEIARALEPGASRPTSVLVEWAHRVGDLAGRERTSAQDLVRDVAANEQVAKVLTDRGFTKEQIDQRLAQLSPQDLHQLAQNIDQVQAAGLTRQEWIWIGIGALAALILVIAVG